eukprot:9139303-Heterocapsa_arctica.AAC.1
MGRRLPLACTVSKRGMGSHRPAPHSASIWASVWIGPAKPFAWSVWHAAIKKSAELGSGTHLCRLAKAS